MHEAADGDSGWQVIFGARGQTKARLISSERNNVGCALLYIITDNAEGNVE